MRVPFSYLPEQFADPEPIFARLREVIATGDFTLGKAVGEFEARFADATGVQFAFGVGSGTEALRLALKLVGAGPGDEVITAANTFIATVGAIADTEVLRLHGRFGSRPHAECELYAGGMCESGLELADGLAEREVAGGDHFA